MSEFRIFCIGALTGFVFSCATTDAWLELLALTILGAVSAVVLFGKAAPE